MNDLLLLGIGGVLSGIGTVLTLQFTGMRTDLKDISSSVKVLNIQIAEVLKDQAWHKEELLEIKSRIALIEKCKNQIK